MRTIQLSGGPDALLNAVNAAAFNGDHQWDLELTDHLIGADEHSNAARAIKITSLCPMADKEINAAGRNYYLLSAQEMEQGTSQS